MALSRPLPVNNHSLRSVSKTAKYPKTGNLLLFSMARVSLGKGGFGWRPLHSGVVHMRSRRRHYPLLALLLALGAGYFPGLALGDWVSLRNGDHLRGINFEKHGKGYRFTLENGEIRYIEAKEFFHLEKSPSSEKITFRGKKITLRKKISILQKETREQLAAEVRHVETWARGEDANAKLKKKPAPGARPNRGDPGGKGVVADPLPLPGLKKPDAKLASMIKNGRQAREKIMELDEARRVKVLALSLAGSRLAAARRLAAGELGKHASSGSLAALARSAMVDDYRSIRDRSLNSLKKINDEQTAMFFAPGLRSENPQVRTRAANGISVFPNRAAVPELLTTMRMTWSGFGRAFMMQVTQRSYIADYELVSGGTGFSIVEIADPVIRTNLEGVALDVKVRRVEMVARLRALHKITGKDFGTNIRAWEQWWAKNKNN